MNLSPITFRFSLVGGLFLAACGSSSPAPSTPSADADDTVTPDDTPAARTALAFTAPCTASACGDVPKTSIATKPVCVASAGRCAWSDPDPNTPVSYRECEATACDAEPDASVCPSGTTFKGANCGAENEGECVWRSVCSAPPSTTPCSDADGCGGKPELGVICKDGSTGDLVCMKQGAACGWERTCE